MQARYYDPVIGRFYSNDPVGFDNVHNFNRYAYANNNPYKYVDPDGKDAIVTLYKGEGGNVFNHIGIGTTIGKNANKTFGKGPYNPLDRVRMRVGDTVIYNIYRLTAYEYSNQKKNKKLRKTNQ